MRCWRSAKIDVTQGRKSKRGPLTLVDGDLALVPPQDVGPLLPRVLLADLTLFAALASAVADDGAGGIVVLVAGSDPSHAVG